MKLDLQVRDLKSGERFPKAFASEDDARAWLKDRPKYTEVLGIASHHVPPELSAELKACNRALDQEEKLLVQQLDAAEEDAARKRAEERMKKERAEAEKAQAAMANADPNRPIELRFTFSDGLHVANPMDKREIPDPVREAAMAWIKERDSWVEGRGQVVGDAKIQLHIGDLPEGTSERIITGTFIPVTAPKKD